MLTEEPSASRPEAKRAENLHRLHAKVQSHGSTADTDPPRTEEDLIQLQYVLAERQLLEGLRTDLGDWRRLNAVHLDVAEQDISILTEKVRGPYEMPILRLIGQQLAQHPDVEFGGANPSGPPEWRRVEIGDEVESIPQWMTIYWDAGTVADVPLVVGTWIHQGERFVAVRSRPEHQERAKFYLDDLLAGAKGVHNPFRARLLKATWSGRGVELTVLPDPQETRDLLVLPEEIWSTLDYNVHRMFDRMHTFRSAGLGSNRGVLLAGPPGTGKTAACRVLAGEVLGEATAIFVESAVGQHLLHQLYGELAGLGPTLVLLEDLDLLTGSREDDSARGALFDFLTVLDGLMTQHHDVVTVATTNDPGAVDAAVRRAARFDQVVSFPLPDEHARERILQVYLRALEHEVDAAAVARATEGRTGADLREFVRGGLLRCEGTLSTADVLAMVPNERPKSSFGAASTSRRPESRYL